VCLNLNVEFNRKDLESYIVVSTQQLLHIPTYLVPVCTLPLWLVVRIVGIRVSFPPFHMQPPRPNVSVHSINVHNQHLVQHNTQFYFPISFMKSKLNRGTAGSTLPGSPKIPRSTKLPTAHPTPNIIPAMALAPRPDRKRRKPVVAPMVAPRSDLRTSASM